MISKTKHFNPLSFTQTSRLMFMGFDASDGKGSKRAKVKIPLMHIGPNAKGLSWTPEVLRKIAPMFKDVVFKYDVGGQEGSSHVPDKLYSPFSDVGWTTKSWYDPKDQILWVEGEVTHPEPLEKLKRVMSNGKRELNYASMGVLIDPDDVVCSICNKKMTTCGHKRQESYDGKVAYAVPQNVEKALHVALTNAPADAEANIAQVIFQESRTLRGEVMVEQAGAPDSYTNQSSRPNSLKQVQVQPQQTTALEQYQKDNAGETMHTVNPIDAKHSKTNEAVGAMADDGMGGTPMDPSTAAPEAEGGDQDVQLTDVIKALIMRLKSLEEKVTQLAGAEETEGAPAPGAEPAPAMGGAPAPEMQDIAGKYYKKLAVEVADLSVSLGKYKNRKEAFAAFADLDIKQLETLSVAYQGIPAQRKIVETANVPEFGMANSAPKVKEFADMSPSERKASFGEFKSWDMCFRA